MSRVRTDTDITRKDTQQARPGPITSTAWLPTDDLHIEEWLHLGKRLGSIGRGAAWWIGDWVNYGNTAFGEKYSRASQITGYDPQSLMNMAYVASRFEPGRRRENLSWSHHAELAALELDIQERWLDRAEGRRLSVRGLREELRTVQRTNAQVESAKNEGEPNAEPGVDRPAADGRTGTEETVATCPNCGYHLVA